MIVVVDYGLGNLASIVNMFKKVGANATIESDVQAIGKAGKLVLPGVGAFGTAMDNIRAHGMLEVLNHKALVEKVPFLGICLGMQLLLTKSEEGGCEGLGWIEGTVKKFSFGAANGLKVPHMGWNEIEVVRDSPMTNGFVQNADSLDKPRFYFVHSYYAEVGMDEHCLTRTTYGIPFASGIGRANIYGFQFHPEKSHGFGKRLLKNFVEL